MKKLVLIALASFMAIQNADAYVYWVTFRTNSPATGPDNYDRVTTSTGTWAGESAFFMDCTDPGSLCCEFKVVAPITFTQTQVSQAVAIKVAQGVNSGQVYADGSSGQFNMQNIQNDKSGRACYLWQVTGYGSNNMPNIKTLIFDGKK